MEQLGNGIWDVFGLFLKTEKDLSHIIMYLLLKEQN